MGRLVDALMAEMAQPELLDAPDLGASRPEPNPCRRLYGPGPAFKTCRGCVHLQEWGSYRRTFHKCDLRACTRGSATDHRARWLACARYEPRQRRQLAPVAPGNP